MKKLLVLCAPLLLAGCAAGINHNVATIDGKPYLIQTKNYAFFVTEWSTKSQFTPLEKDDMEVLQAKKHLEQITAQCKKQVYKARKNREAASYTQMLKDKAALYDCITKKMD